jgi:hypothetical protein
MGPGIMFGFPSSRFPLAEMVSWLGSRYPSGLLATKFGLLTHKVIGSANV